MSQLDQIRGRLEAATPGPWGLATAATADGEVALSRQDKAEFLELALNDDESTLSVVLTDEVIPAVTGDGPASKENAEFIANAPMDVAQLVADVQNVLNLHAPGTEGSDEPYCRHCYAPPYGHAPYPCPTVQCITSALEAKP